jgi:hypothetical protein
VLHIVLDHPPNMKVPVLDQPCLEFQWHHHNARDIASKPFVQACGDLNMVVAILVVWNCFGMGMIQTPLGRTLTGLKILMAYAGQFNHRVSHQAKHEKHPAVVWLQEHHVLLSNAAHHVHHTEPHDSNFCIGCGVTNLWLNWFIRNVCNSPAIWGVWFLGVSLLDMWFLKEVCQHVGVFA